METSIKDNSEEVKLMEYVLLWAKMAKNIKDNGQMEWNKEMEHMNGQMEDGTKDNINWIKGME